MSTGSTLPDDACACVARFPAFHSGLVCSALVALRSFSLRLHVAFGLVRLLYRHRAVQSKLDREQAEQAARALELRRSRQHLEEARLRKHERNLRQQMGLYRGAQLPPLPQNVNVEDVEPHVLKEVLQEESARLGMKLNALQDEEDSDDEQERELSEMRRLEKQKRLEERRERIRVADERRFTESQDRQRRREQAERDEEARILRMTQPKSGGSTPKRRKSPPPEKPATPSPEPVDDPVAEPVVDPREAKRQSLQQQAAEWQEAAGDVYGAFGVSPDWLVHASMQFLQIVDHERNGLLAPELILRILAAPALGLNIASEEEALLMASIRELPGSGGLVKYPSLLPALAGILTIIALNDVSLDADRDCWCSVYDPVSQQPLWYNKATREIALGEHPVTGAAAAVEDDAAMADGADACRRVVMHVMNTCSRSLEDDPRMMEEDIFYMMLQSTEIGLDLSQKIVEAYKDDMPPEQDGNVDFVEACADLPSTLAGVIEQQSSSNHNWCCMYSAEDTLFFYNKATQKMCKTRPAAFRPTVQDQDINNFLFSMFASSDPSSSGMIDDAAFWELLEAAPPMGLHIVEEDSFAMMSKFDLSIDGKVPYRKFVPLFRALMIQVSEESEDTPEGPYWVQLEYGGVKFWFDKVDAVCSRTNPGVQEASKAPAQQAPQPAKGALELPRNELSEPVYAKLSTRFSSTIGMFATYLSPAPSTGPAYVSLTTQYPSTVSSFASYPTSTKETDANDADEEPNSYRKLSTSYPSTIGMYA